MQSADIISLNIWQIVISLCNLTILFLIIKKFLFKPVKKLLAEREALANAEYDKAKQARADAEKSRSEWDEKMKTADAEADRIVKNAADNAKALSEHIEADAKEKAEHILTTAREGAELEYKRASDSLRSQIADVSTAIAEKVIGKHIDEATHHELIDSFLDGIGDDDE